jgi:hypothetical protein
MTVELSLKKSFGNYENIEGQGYPGSFGQGHVARDTSSGYKVFVKVAINFDEETIKSFDCERNV